ncbi:hypothetical protein K523DRAFT_405492 [Schizophyllum commune Tattone D]|nr:hypothetical protein K523DRAFT_405492 [Schizophyllum commune Tattone D]
MLVLGGQSVDDPNLKRCRSRSPPPLRKSCIAQDTQRYQRPAHRLHTDACAFADAPTAIREPRAPRDQRTCRPPGSLDDSASTANRHAEKVLSHDSEEDSESDMDWSIDAYGTICIEDSTLVDDSKTQSDGDDSSDRPSTGAEGGEATALMSNAGVGSPSNHVPRDAAGSSRVILSPYIAIFPHAYGSNAFIPLTLAQANAVYSNEANVFRKFCPWALHNDDQRKSQRCNAEISGNGLRDFIRNLQGHIQTAHNPPVEEIGARKRYLCRAILDTPNKCLCRSRITTGIPYKCRLAAHIAREHLGVQVPQNYNPYEAESSSV